MTPLDLTDLLLQSSLELGTVESLRQEARKWSKVYAQVFPSAEPEADLSWSQQLFSNFHFAQPGVAETESFVDLVGPASAENMVATAHFLWRWDHIGRPTFSLTHSLLAQLAQTDCAGLNYGELKWPFETFAVQLPQPDPFIVYEGRPGQQVTARYLIFSRYHAPAEDAPAVYIGVQGLNAPMLHRKMLEPQGGDGLEQWLTMFTDVGQIEQVGHGLRYEEIDGQAMRTAIRVVTNLSLYLQSLRQRGEWAPSAPGAKKKPKSDNRYWIIGKGIKVAPEVRSRAYHNATGEPTRTLDKRYMVRGHWRNQAHGPKRELRRLKWIEPYWKGPEGAESLERSYSVGD